MNWSPKHPAAANGRARGEVKCQAASNLPEIIAPSSELQAARARWLTQHFGLAPTMATMIAALCFGETRP
jgi:hypothetical protein